MIRPSASWRCSRPPARSSERENGSQLRLALADAERRFDLPRDALSDLIAGVEMDVRGEHYVTFDELVVYCRRVAGTIGRLCLAIFGSTDPERAAPLAEDLGVAMQLDEHPARRPRGSRSWPDLPPRRGPAPLRRATTCSPPRPTRSPQLIRFEVARAREWFDRGLGLLELVDVAQRRRACRR